MHAHGVPRASTVAVSCPVSSMRAYELRARAGSAIRPRAGHELLHQQLGRLTRSRAHAQAAWMLHELACMRMAGHAAQLSCELPHQERERLVTLHARAQASWALCEVACTRSSSVGAV